MAGAERDPPPSTPEPTPGKEYYIKSAGGWYKGTARQGYIFTNVKRHDGTTFVDLPPGTKEFGSGATFYELTPAAKKMVTEATNPQASAEEGGKRRRKKATRKGSRKSRRTTRRKRFT